MYDYRRLTTDQRSQVLEARRERGFPLHAPPHFRGEAGEYLISAACYEHRRVFDGPELLSWLAEEVLDAFAKAGFEYDAWVFLPNHYHVLTHVADLGHASETLRKLHSRLATQVNSRQEQRGRRVWYRYSDRQIRNERHHFASLNYLHHNPVRHGYVAKMEHWPWSSVHEYLENEGREWLKRLWDAYPIPDYGKGWDW